MNNRIGFISFGLAVVSLSVVAGCYGPAVPPAAPTPSCSATATGRVDGPYFDVTVTGWSNIPSGSRLHAELTGTSSPQQTPTTLARVDGVFGYQGSFTVSGVQLTLAPYPWRAVGNVSENGVTLCSVALDVPAEGFTGAAG